MKINEMINQKQTENGSREMDEGQEEKIESATRAGEEIINEATKKEWLTKV